MTYMARFSIDILSIFIILKKRSFYSSEKLNQTQINDDVTEASSATLSRNQFARLNGMKLSDQFPVVGSDVTGSRAAESDQCGVSLDSKITPIVRDSPSDRGRDMHSNKSLNAVMLSNSKTVFDAEQTQHKIEIGPMSDTNQTKKICWMSDVDQISGRSQMQMSDKEFDTNQTSDTIHKSDATRSMDQNQLPKADEIQFQNIQ